jgi:hypothetical protein
MSGSIGLTAAIGGILLAIVIIYAIIRNQRRTQADRRRTEEATKDLYARVDRQDQVSDPDPAKY